MVNIIGNEHHNRSSNPEWGCLYFHIVLILLGKVYVYQPLHRNRMWHKVNHKSRLQIELPWPENPANTCARHIETLDSCFDLIRSHQQCILWSPPLEIEPATTECRAKTLPLSHKSTSHTDDTESTSHGNQCWWDPISSKQLSSVSVCRTQVLAGFSGYGNSIHNIIPLLKKIKCTSSKRF